MIKTAYKLGVFIARKLGMYDTRQERYIDIINQHIGEGLTLDVGCGQGQLTRMLKGRTVGLDVSAEALSRFKEDTGTARVLADAHNMPFRSKAFNNVVAISLLEHLEHPKTVSERQQER